MVTGRQYAEKCMEVEKLVPKAGYIYGASNRGLVWTKAKQDALVKKYNSNPSKYADLKLSAAYGSKWIGHVVYDCSGLTSGKASELGLSYHHGSNSSYRYDCAYKGVKTSGMKLPIGAWVYTGTANSHGHIGTVVSDTEVLEAQGTKAGVIRSSINLAKWTYWGLGKGIEFDFIPGQENVSTPVTPSTPANQETQNTSSYPTLRKGVSNKTYVKKLQTLLVKDGANIVIDGIFGPKTLEAVKAFQKKYNLVVDGIVGPKTWSKLLSLK